MKKNYTLVIALLFTSITSAQIVFCEDFESYSANDPIAQTSDDWETWTSYQSSAPYFNDANVSSIVSTSGSNSLYFQSSTSGGGPADVIFPFTNAPYTSGVFEFVSNFYVNTGLYFNFQGEINPASQWSLVVSLYNGEVDVRNHYTGDSYVVGTYPPGSWFEMKIIADMTNNNYEVFIDDASIGSFTSLHNKISSLNLYPLNGDQFYVDDLCYSHSDSALSIVNPVLSNVETYPNPVSQKLWIVNNSENKDLMAKVFDMRGNLVLHSNISRMEDFIDVSKLPAAVYQLQLTGEEYYENELFIKE